MAIAVLPASVGLTPRQRSVVGLLARGLTNKEIAAELGIGSEGVKAHVSRLLLKVGVRNRVALIAALQAADVRRDVAGQTVRSLEAISTGLAHEGTGGGVSSAAVSSYAESVDRMIASVGADPSDHFVARLGALRESLGAIKLAVELAGALPEGTIDTVLLDAINSRTVQAILAVNEISESMRVDLRSPTGPRVASAKSAAPRRRSSAKRRTARRSAS